VALSRFPPHIEHVDILEQVEPSYEFLVCDSSHAPDQIPPIYTIDAYIDIYIKMSEARMTRQLAGHDKSKGGKYTKYQIRNKAQKNASQMETKSKSEWKTLA